MLKWPDIVVCVASIGIAAVCNLPMVLRKFLWPHGVILAAFAAFVVWNGGVVLGRHEIPLCRMLPGAKSSKGDKSNHVATLHLAQMLYIWPFFAFFSAPLFVPQLLSRAIMAYQTLTSRAYQQSPTGLLNHVSSIHLATTALVSYGALAVALLIVRFNTIIHPFTLADNRHYVFYVFRYSILRAWWARYALAPVYVVCAWMCWDVLRGFGVSHPAAQEKWIRSPFITTAGPNIPPSGHSATIEKASSARGNKTTVGAEAEAEAEAGPTPPPTSTVLLLLLTTTLSLVTAPLVEPRYFILPWLFWRLLVPATNSIPSPSSSPSQQASAPGSSNTSQLKEPRQGSDQSSSSSSYFPTLFLETAWFLLINAATMYVFVTRPFYWRAPDGTLQDEGRVQRFMW